MYMPQCVPLAIVLCTAVVAGCQTAPPTPLYSRSLADVLKAVKDDVNAAQTYLLWAQSQPAGSDTCGTKFGYDLLNVQLSLAVAASKTDNGTVSATIPIFGTGSVGPSVGSSKTFANTQTLTFYIYPGSQSTDASEMPRKFDLRELSESALRDFAAKSPGEQTRALDFGWSIITNQEPKLPGDAESFPITAAMHALHNGLVATDKIRPCFTLAKNKDDKVNTIQYAFTLDQQASTSLPVKFLVFSIGGGTTEQAKTVNTVVVSFQLAKLVKEPDKSLSLQPIQ